MIRVTLALVCAAATAVAAQSPSKPKASKTKGLTLVGCVSPDEANAGHVTFADAKDGTVYKLSGASAREYVGKRVRIVGATNPNRIHVRGGLTPSPNTAAQAGAMDPARAAVEAQGAYRGTGPAELPEFIVKTVKPVKGDCPGR